MPISDPKLKAFLDLIAWSEGTIKGLDGGYGVIVSGIDGPHTFTDYSTHPFANGRPPIVINHRGLLSTASGRYQQLLHNWTIYKVRLRLLDFGHDAQDAMALQLMKERGAVELLDNDQVTDAVVACSSAWASLPGNNYGQPTRSMEDLVAQYFGYLRQGGL